MVLYKTVVIWLFRKKKSALLSLTLHSLIFAQHSLLTNNHCQLRRLLRLCRHEQPPRASSQLPSRAPIQLPLRLSLAPSTSSAAPATTTAMNQVRSASASARASCVSHQPASSAALALATTSHSCYRHRQAG